MLEFPYVNTQTCPDSIIKRPDVCSNVVWSIVRASTYYFSHFLHNETSNRLGMVFFYYFPCEPPYNRSSGEYSRSSNVRPRYAMAYGPGKKLLSFSFETSWTFFVINWNIAKAVDLARPPHNCLRSRTLRKRVQLFRSEAPERRVVWARAAYVIQSGCGQPFLIQSLLLPL